MLNSMKFVFSRKGFDSSYGGHPSPILPDGTIISLPIPSNDPDKYFLLTNGNKSYLSIMRELFGDLKDSSGVTILRKNTRCHLDPDICKGIKPRKSGWRGAFGQISSAQQHLENQGISKGDIFIFFGWFRNTLQTEDGLVYDRQDPRGRHVMFGYLQEIIRHGDKIPAWLFTHPHCDSRRMADDSNAIYVARKRLSLNPKYSGYGIFNYTPRHVLTKKGCNRSLWSLPSFFRSIDMSYHSNSKKYGWKKNGFQSVAKGQEFVYHGNKQVKNWFLGK